MQRILPVVPMFVVAVSIAYSVHVAVQRLRPILPPPIPGATPAEQRSDPVMRGFAMGRDYQRTLLVSHADSWLAGSRHFEDGASWDQVQERWAGQDRTWRDEPFDRIVRPEIDHMLGQAPEDPARRRNVVLFLRGFAAGLKDWR